MAPRKTAAKANPTTSEDTNTPEQNVKQEIKVKEVDLHEYVTVKNGSVGKLVYVSPRTGERFVWEEFGDEQEMELQELKNAKAANKKFFERNWFMFDDEFDWVIDYLGVRAFYKHAIGIDGFDDLFKKTPAAIAKIVGELTDGQKRSVSFRARQLIADGEIDSMKVIASLEKCLGVDLIEK